MAEPGFDDPFRPAWEWWSILGWTFAASGLTVWILLVPAPAVLFGAVVFCLLCGLRDLPSALRVRARHRRLCGTPLRFGSLPELAARVHERPEAIWLGQGFVWGADHAQMALELRRRGNLTIQSEKQSLSKGLPWIHGLGASESPVWLPVEFARGHTLIVGTTGSGKTRLLENLLAQAILRDEAVLIFDPKGDRALQNTVRSVCAFQGKPERYAQFDRARPAESVRLDPLGHFQSGAELASRIAGLMGGGPGPDVFSGFSQKTLKIVIDALLALGERPTLKTLLRHVEGGVDGLLQRLLIQHLTRHLGADWQCRVVAGPGLGKAGGSTQISPALRDLVQAWRSLQAEQPGLVSGDVDGLLALLEHDRTHAQKLIAGLLPVLHMLCSGPLGDLLSPSADDAHDHRPIVDFDSLIANRHVLYIGLDSLSDPLVGAALGRLLLADLASLAGSMYQRPDRPVPISCYIDEAAECLNEPAIALLNKGRGAGFSMTLLTQTFADFVAAAGSDAKARQILGNTNNLICLRVRDAGTQQYVAEQMPEVLLRSMTHAQSAGNAPLAPIVFNGQASEALSEQRAPLVDPNLLGALPDLECFAQIAGGQVYKLTTSLLELELSKTGLADGSEA
ncbi:MAG: conjugative transfer system coupling protein TraD [Ahniella sp.]|nr:conjugative transfer system coupling protein TraD [Ahniella sp.]